MIYRTDSESGRVYEVLDWKLYTADRRPVSLGSEDELRAYLKSHPDEDFFLVPNYVREIQGATPPTFDPQGEHIRAGIVCYDSAAGKIVTSSGLKVVYTPRAKQWKTGLEMLRQATPQLEKVLGPSAYLAIATWDRVEDEKGRSVYTLTLSDWLTAETVAFTADELNSEWKMRMRLYRQWGDVLQVRSDVEHRKVEQKVEQLISGPIVEGA